MKIKNRDLSYDSVMALPREEHQMPIRQSRVLAALVRLLAKKDLRETEFSFSEIGMERLPPEQPAMFLMNHSSFIDLKIAFTLLKGRRFSIVCTSDGFVGKNWIMQLLSCIPTSKFLTDVTLVMDIRYAIKSLKSSILMYPEASYSFDGTATPLPQSLGKFLRAMRVPVVMIRTYGAFARDPLYNNLQLRKVKVSATMEYLLSPEDLKSRSVSEINDILKDHFTFDNFRWQKENGVRIAEPFRADGLNRVLYKCPCCNTEGKMVGRGTTLKCESCGKEWEMTELGEVKALDGKDFFTQVPDWYNWERSCVRSELEDGSYGLDIPVDIRMLVDTKCLYNVGSGRLVHSVNGFHLTGCDGKLDFSLPPLASYSLYSDYFWYELGDMICIGDKDALYYCFPKEGGDVVAKTRLAAEELYKISSRK